MDRKEIKAEAKLKIKGNKWNILWPMLALGLIESVISRIFGLNVEIDTTNLTTTTDLSSVTTVKPSVLIGSIILALVVGIVTIAYKKYIINFVRTGKFEFNDIIDTVKAKWVNIFVAELLVAIIVYVCTLLFVIPGIIMALAYGMVAYVVVDTDLSGVDSLKKSRAMMKGYKWNYFVFGLSFIGWILLTPFTLCILLIWLIPYITVADALYYEKLKSLSK